MIAENIYYYVHSNYTKGNTLSLPVAIAIATVGGVGLGVGSLSFAPILTPVPSHYGMLVSLVWPGRECNAT